MASGCVSVLVGHGQNFSEGRAASSAGHFSRTWSFSMIFGHPGDRYRFLTSPNKYEKERESETETVGFQGPKLVSFKGLCVRSFRENA